MKMGNRCSHGDIKFIQQELFVKEVSVVVDLLAYTYKNELVYMPC